LFEILYEKGDFVMDQPRTPSPEPGKVSPTFDVTRHQVPDKRAASSSKRPREMVDTGTTNEPTLKKPKRELTKVNIQLISDISEDDVSKTAGKRITNCERVISNPATSAEEKEKYRKAIPLIKEAQESILAKLKEKLPEDRENSIKALAASDNHMIQHILKEIARGKQQASTSDKGKGPAETGGHISEDSHLDPPNLSIIIKNISDAEILDKVDRFIKSCDEEVENIKATKAKAIFKEARELIREEFENKSPEIRERFIRTYLNYSGSEQSKRAVHMFFQSIVDEKQQAPTSDKGKEPARLDAPPSQTSEDVNTADISPFVETLKHRKSAIERIRTLASTASAQDSPDYDVGKAQRNGDLQNACNEFLLSEELTENAILKSNYPDVYGAHDEQYVTNLINVMYEVEEKEAPKLKGRGSTKLEIISEILELYEKRNLPQV
jgi:hypothetical protein